jgi:hypothetical protein
MNEGEKEKEWKGVGLLTAETLHPIYFSNALFTIKLRCSV